MNLTITCLKLFELYYSSPFISHTNFFPHSQHLISKSIFSHSFKSAFYSNSNNIDLRLTNSKFTHFLSSSIRINGFEMNNEVRHRTSTFRHPFVNISHCEFSFCNSESNGGAIDFSIQGSKFYVQDSIFHTNEASSNGGGFYFIGLGFSLKRLCFISCKCKLFGQAYFIQGEADLPDELNDSLLFNCAPEPFIRCSFGTYNQKGAANYHYNNYSFNQCVRGGSAITTSLCDSKFVTYSLFCNNTGGRLIDFQFCQVRIDIFRCNFIGNVATMLTVIGFSYMTYVTECFFQANSIPIALPGGGREHSIIFAKCVSDKLGITDQNGIAIHDGHDLMALETTVIIPRRYKNPCVHIDNDGKGNIEDINWFYIIGISILVILSHLIIIQTHLFISIYRSLFFDTRETKRKRIKRAPRIRLE